MDHIGQPVTEVWFTTTEKIHEIIRWGHQEYLQLGENSIYFLMQPMVVVAWRCHWAAPYDNDRSGHPRNTPPDGCVIISGY